MGGGVSLTYNLIPFQNGSGLEIKDLTERNGNAIPSEVVVRYRVTLTDSSGKTYTVRFGIKMLMAHYLDDDFKPEYLQKANAQSDEYYINMMVAWYFATALAKQYNSALPYLEQGRLETRTHNMAIQKAIESRRIATEQKQYLKTLKRR